MALSDITEILGTNNLDEGRIKINDGFAAVKNYLENLTAEQISNLIVNGEINSNYLKDLTIDDILDRANHTGTQPANSISGLTDAIENFINTSLEVSTLNQLNIDAGSVDNFTKSELLDRDNHTGTQDASTISNLESVVNNSIESLVTRAYINDLNVDAVTLNNKPSSDYVQFSNVGEVNGVASLDPSGKVPFEQIPPLSLTGVTVVKTEAERDEIANPAIGLLVKVTNQITNTLPYTAEETRGYNVTFTATDSGASDGASCDFSITVNGSPVYTETVTDGTSSTISENVSVTTGDVIDVNIETAEGSISSVSITTDGGQEKTYIWDGSEWIELTSSANIQGVNGKTEPFITLTTDDISDSSSTNKYYSSALANADIEAKVDAEFVNNLDINPTQLNGVGADNYVRSDVSDTIQNNLTVNGTLNANVISEGGNTLIPPGVIVMWSGSSIPNGWLLCDGNNGTPDLRNRFIVGAGSSYGVGTSGGGENDSTQDTVTTSSAGGHSHNITIFSSGSHSHDLNVNGTSLSTSQLARHTHDYYVGYRLGSLSPRGSTFATGNSASHTHNGNTTTEGSHSHTASASSQSSHTHEVRVQPPYYALAYIMKE